MNYTTRITDWTRDRSDRRRAARRDVRFYHVGVPQLKQKKFIFMTRTTLFSKKNIKFKVALRPRLGLKPMVISVSNHGRRVVKSDTPSSTPCVWAVTLCIVCQGVRGDEARRARCSEEEHRGVGGERRPLRPSECAL